MTINFKSFTDGFKTVVRNLPVIRQEAVAAVTAAASMVGVFEVTFPSISIAHLTFFATLTATLVGIASFFSNSKVAQDINTFSDQPVWKKKLTYLRNNRC